MDKYKTGVKMKKIIVEGNLHFVFVTARCQEVFFEDTKKVAENVIRRYLEENGVDSFHVVHQTVDEEPEIEESQGMSID